MGIDFKERGFIFIKSLFSVEIMGDVYCMQCTRDLKSEEKFCGLCGRPRNVVQQEWDKCRAKFKEFYDASTTCRNCGMAKDFLLKFCTQCGTKY